MAWQDNKLCSNLMRNLTEYGNQGIPFLYGEYNRKVDNKDAETVKDNVENPPPASFDCETGFIAANIFQLQLPHEAAEKIPLSFKSQFSIWSKVKRYEEAVRPDKRIVRGRMIFTFRGLALIPDYAAYATDFNVKTTKLSDNTIACYVKNLRCRVIRDYYISEGYIDTLTDSQWGPYSKSLYNTDVPIDQTGFYYSDAVLSRGDVNDILSGISHYKDANYDHGASYALYQRKELYVVLHNVVLAQMSGVLNSNKLNRSAGFMLMSAKGLSVWCNNDNFDAIATNNGIDYAIENIAPDYGNKDFVLDVPKSYSFDYQQQHASEILSRKERLASPIFDDLGHAGDVQTKKAQYLRHTFNSLFSDVEFTNYDDDYDGNRSVLRDDSFIDVYAVNSYNGTGLQIGHAYTVKDRTTHSITPKDEFEFYLLDESDDKTKVTGRYDYTGSAPKLTQSFMTISIFGYTHNVSTSIQHYESAPSTEFTLMTLTYNMYLSDYFRMYGGDTVMHPAGSYAADNAHTSTYIAYYAENDTTATSTDLTFSDLTDIDKVLKEHYYSLLPQELEYLFKSKADNGGFIHKFTETAKIILQSAFQSYLPNLDANSLEQTIEQYNIMEHARPDKSMFRTPSEYYSESRDASDLTLFDSDRLTSTGSAISSSDVPLYFWVETLKNWCYFKLNNYDTENNTASEAILCVWNGMNGWYELGNLLSFTKSTYIDLDKLTHLNTTQASDNALFQGLLKYMLTRLGYYPFPLENLHTVDIDRIYYPCDPKFEGQSKGWFRRQWENVKSIGSNLAKIGGGMWDALTSPSAWFTDEDFFDKLFGGWKDVFTGWVGLMGDTWNTFLGTTISVIAEMFESDPNPDFYNSDLDKKIYAKCYYVKLPYDTHYSSNEPSTYQTLRVQHRAEKAYGSIDGGLDYDKVHAAMFNVIPTTIGSPFVVRSSTGELMMAYRMMHSGPVKQDKDKTHNIVKYTGIAQIDVDFSNQLLRSCFGSGDDKTIENWLDTIGDSIDFVPTDIANAAVSNLSTQVVEQFNSNSSACGKMKITSNRSRTTTVTETDTINTVQKW